MMKIIIQVVQTGSKNVEMAVMRKGEPMKLLETEEIDKYVKMIEAEKEAEAEKKKAKKLAAAAAAEGSSKPQTFISQLVFNQFIL